MELAGAAGWRCGGEREGMMEGVCSDGAAVQRAGSQDIGEGKRVDTMTPRDLPPSPPPPRLPRSTYWPSFSRRTGLQRSSLVTNYGMEIEDQLFLPADLEPLPRPTNLEQRQVWDKSYNGGRRKKWVAVLMYVGRRKMWVACAATFIVLLILFKPIYRWTLPIVSGHTREDLCGVMILVCLTERHMISVYQRLKCTFMVYLLVTRMVCLWVRSTVCLWVPRIERPDTMLITNLPRQLMHSMAYYVDYIIMEVAATMYEISILLWEFGARYVACSVNQAKTSEERAIPHRARQRRPRIRGLYGMDIYKNKVHEFLQNERSDESFFGICGRPGVGKTRLLSLISDCYGDSFRHVFALGGGSVRDMQYNLTIFLKLDWEPMSLLEEHHRAKIIAEYLEHGSFLLLLDNVQDGLVDLAAIGLPMPLGRRQKVVLVSRSQVVCGRMGCTIQNTIEMKCLGDEDAWSLFKYNVGVEFTDADTEIHKIAKEMVSACGGLPRAIRAIGIGVAGATYSGKEPDDWLFAYERFKAKNLPPERMEEIVSVLV